VCQKANEIKVFLKKFLSMQASKLVAKTNGKSVVSATRKTNERVQIIVLGQIGVGRSLSSVDNIGCLHHRLTDNRFGGIRLETGEQATSPTPTSSHQQQRHQGVVHRWHQILAHETSNDFTNRAACTS
jgi:hypothetical protein